MASKEARRQRKISEFSATRPSSDRMEGARIAESAGRGEQAALSPKESQGISLELQKIMLEITGFRTEMSAKTDRMEIKMDLFQNRFTAMDERMREMEDRISSLEDRTTPVEKTTDMNSKTLKGLLDRQDDLENRSRRNNVRILGLGEGSEQNPNAVFFEKLIKEIFPNAPFTTFYSVVRAHRTLGPRPPPGAPARAVLVRFLHYRDRDVVLAAARQAGEVTHNGARLQFYQDLSMNVQRARKKFDTAKAMLRERKVPYAMLFPAKLRVAVNGRVHFFTEAETACAYIEQLPKDGRRNMQNNNAAEAANNNGDGVGAAMEEDA